MPCAMLTPPVLKILKCFYMLIFTKEMQRNNVMATEKYKLEEKNS